MPSYCHCMNGSYYILITDLHIKKKKRWLNIHVCSSSQFANMIHLPDLIF